MAARPKRGKQRGKQPAKGRSPLRRTLVWTLRGALVLFGLWLGYEAWRFPDVGSLARVNPGRTSFMRYRIEEARARGREYHIQQDWVPLAQISRHLQRAVVLSEDARFFQHRGFDRSEIRDALEDHILDGKRLRGASTLSQQLAKNLWLGPERDLLRKLREALYTAVLERRLSKQRILEIYLNVVEWGPGVFGAEAAARRSFGVSARDLGAMPAARLAVVLPNPLRRDPVRLSAGLEKRARALVVRLGEPPPPVAPAEETRVSAAAPPPVSRAAEPSPSPSPRPSPVPSRTPAAAATPRAVASPVSSPVNLLAPP